MKAPRLTDTTLRDGSHPMAHRYTVEQAVAIASELDAGGVDVIEVSHGDGLAGSSLQYGVSATPELELIAAVREVVSRAQLAVLLIPGIGTREDLTAAAERGAEVVRIATQCTEADVSEQHFGLARELGLEPIGFLMMSHLRPPEAIAEQAALMESYGASCVYVVDSAGAMLPEDAAARVRALRQALQVEVGFHAHNNLGCAIGNSLAATAAGATRVDGCLRGLGAGAGNAATELLAAAFDRQGLEHHLDLFALLDAAEHVVAPIMPFQPFPDRDAIVLGYAGVYSTFLLHAQRLGERHGVDPRDVLVELGRRGAVAGQEDWILDVTLALAEAKEEAADAAA
jgi:4-hydroxy 2-oxovalerate aldolase